MKFHYPHLVLAVLTAMLGSKVAIGQTTVGAPTIGIQTVEITSSLQDAAEEQDRRLGRQDKKLSLRRVADSLEQQVLDRIHNTRKFTVVSHSELKTLLKDQDLQSFLGDPSDANVAQSFKIAGCKYALVVTVDDFQDEQTKLMMEGQQAVATKRKVRLSSVGKIYEVATGKLLESANFQLAKGTGTEIQAGTRNDSAPHEELLVQMTREMAQQIAGRVTDVVFPAKIMAITGKLATLTRGDGSGIEKGQVWTVYATGKQLVDPDTQEVLGVEEIPIGKVKVVNVTPKFSQAEIIEDFGVAEGQILRLESGAPTAE